MKWQGCEPPFSPEASNKNIKPHGPLHSKVLLLRVSQTLPSPGHAAVSQSWPWGVCQDNLFLTKAWWHPLNPRPWKAAGHEHRSAPSQTCQQPQKGITVGETLPARNYPLVLPEKTVSVGPNSEPFAVGFVAHTLMQEGWLHLILLWGGSIWGTRICCWLRFKNELSRTDFRAKLEDYLKQDI